MGKRREKPLPPPPLHHVIFKPRTSAGPARCWFIGFRGIGSGCGTICVGLRPSPGKL